MDLPGIGWGGMALIDLPQDGNQWQAGCCEHGNEPLGFVNCWEVLG
jgi:hypothetical protein